MFTTFGKKRQTAQGWLGNKLKSAQVQGSKFLKHPVTKTVATIGLTVAGAVAKKKLDNVKESREERNKGERIMAQHRDTEHKFQMDKIDPGGLAKKRLDEFVATKPFEDAFDFDAPF